MKTLIAILLALQSHAQCPVKYDTIPQPYIVPDKPRLYNYYNRDGSLRWGGVKDYDTTLMAPGGSWTIYISGGKATIKSGWVIYRTAPDCNMEEIGYLDENKKPLIIKFPIYKPLIAF